MSDSGKQVRLGTSFSRPDTSARANLPSDVSPRLVPARIPASPSPDGIGPSGLCPFRFSPTPDYLSCVISKRRRRRRRSRESRLSQEIAEIRAEVERIKADPAAVEQVARDELGMVRQTEVVFQFGSLTLGLLTGDKSNKVVLGPIAVTVPLTCRLLESKVLPRADVATALRESCQRGISVVQALLESNPLAEGILNREFFTLERSHVVDAHRGSRTRAKTTARHV